MRENTTMSVAERSSCWRKILKHKQIELDGRWPGIQELFGQRKGMHWSYLHLAQSICHWYATKPLIFYFDPQFSMVNDNISTVTSFIVSIHSQKKKNKHRSIFPNMPFRIYCFLLLETFKQQSLRRTKPHRLSSIIHLRGASKSLRQISHTYPANWLLWRPSQFQLQFQSHFCQPNCIV